MQAEVIQLLGKFTYARKSLYLKKANQKVQQKTFVYMFLKTKNTNYHTLLFPNNDLTNLN